MSKILVGIELGNIHSGVIVKLPNSSKPITFKWDHSGVPSPKTKTCILYQKQGNDWIILEYGTRAYEKFYSSKKVRSVCFLADRFLRWIPTNEEYTWLPNGLTMYRILNDYLLYMVQIVAELIPSDQREPRCYAVTVQTQNHANVVITMLQDIVGPDMRVRTSSSVIVYQSVEEVSIQEDGILHVLDCGSFSRLYSYKVQEHYRTTLLNSTVGLTGIETLDEVFLKFISSKLGDELFESLIHNGIDSVLKQWKLACISFLGTPDQQSDPSFFILTLPHNISKTSIPELIMSGQDIQTIFDDVAELVSQELDCCLTPEDTLAISGGLSQSAYFVNHLKSRFDCNILVQSEQCVLNGMVKYLFDSTRVSTLPKGLGVYVPSAPFNQFLSSCAAGIPIYDSLANAAIQPQTTYPSTTSPDKPMVWPITHSKVSISVVSFLVRKNVPSSQIPVDVMSIPKRSLFKKSKLLPPDDCTYLFSVLVTTNAEEIQLVFEIVDTINLMVYEAGTLIPSKVISLCVR